jgi:formylglycine-generating enzyme required for sulfatase activity
MHGNVWEWCNDWYDKNYYKQCKDSGTAMNPKGPNKGVDRVLRGGSWAYSAEYCRSADRDWDAPGDRYNLIGFRLARGHMEKEQE